MKKLKLVICFAVSAITISACSNQAKVDATTVIASSVESTAAESTTVVSSEAESTTEEPTVTESTTEVTTEAESTTETSTVAESTTEVTTEPETTTAAPAEAEIVDNSKQETGSIKYAPNPKDKISSKVKSVIKDSTSQTKVSITSISVNENLGTDEENDFVVLAYLSFDVKNNAKTTKEMLVLLNNQIGANMAGIDNISELTIFWEVPYLNSSNDNIAKANLLRNDKGFYFEDEWYDSSIFE